MNLRGKFAAIAFFFVLLLFVIKGGNTDLGLVASFLGMAGGALLVTKVANTSKFQLLGRWVRKGDVKRKLVALTFDDGPNLATRCLLDVLRQNNAKATFFCIGRQIKEYPEIVKEIVNDGHQLGNHSYSHQRMINRSPNFIRHEICRTDELIRLSGYSKNIDFRAPFGVKFVALPFILWRMNKTSIFWDVDPRDFERKTPSTISDHIIGNVNPGSIILLHDSFNTALAVGQVIPELRAQGFEFVTVDELTELALVG